MADTTAEVGVEHDHDDAHDHPSDLDYVKVFLALVVLTAVEVATFFIEMPTPMLIISLGVLMFVKFYLIAAWFMHLRTDSILFSRFFVTGLVGALIIYVIMLSTFLFWDGFSF